MSKKLLKMAVSRASSAGSSVSTTAKPPGPSIRPKNCKKFVPSAGDHFSKTCRDRACISSVMFGRDCQETTYFMLDLRSRLGGSRPPCGASAFSRKHQPASSSMVSFHPPVMPPVRTPTGPPIAPSEPNAGRRSATSTSLRSRPHGVAWERNRSRQYGPHSLVRHSAFLGCQKGHVVGWGMNGYPPPERVR